MEHINNNHYSQIKKSYEYILQKKDEIWNHHHRLAFHLDPPTNWMNDPNGLVYFKGDYHVFFQFNPYKPENGPKYWGHFRSPDLINWELLPPAIAPVNDYDLGGCFSGSSIVYEDELVLFYTGHVDFKSPKEVQCIATSKDGVVFEKWTENPVIPNPPEGFSEDFRDPKVWEHEGVYYVVIGNKENDHGQVLLYSSNDLQTWKFEGILAQSNGKQGFMWECPDLVHIGNQDVLILSPEGMDNQAHKSIYITGNMDYHLKKFTQNAYYDLDYGTDFYAPQTFKDDKGRTIMYGWMNLWESDMPTQKMEWVGSLTIPRELKINSDNQLTQHPVEELKELRRRAHELSVSKWDGEKIVLQPVEFGEIVVSFDYKDEDYTFGLKVRCSKELEEETKILVNPRKKKIYIDRTKSGEGDTAIMEAPLRVRDNRCELHLFLDRSSLEVFTDEGRTVLTTRIYPQQSSKDIRLFSEKPIDVEMILWELEDKMKDLKTY